MSRLDIIYLQDFLAMEIGGNRISGLVTALLVFCIVLAGMKIAAVLFIRMVSRVEGRINFPLRDMLADKLADAGFFSFFAVALYFASLFIKLPETGGNLIFAIFGLVVTYWIVQVVHDLSIHLIGRAGKKRGGNVEGLPSAVPLLIKALLWVFGLLLIMSNVGINITSLVAGLGIGGAAVALASQNILGDLFSSFSIYLDKPFKIGDFIIIGGDMGVVKTIGWKTTRIQALQGEEIVISNRELTESRVRNFKLMKERRIQFSFGINYDTPTEKLMVIRDRIGERIASIPNVRLDRVHLKELGESSLVYEVAYYVLNGDYNQYMDIQQQINLKILEGLKLEGSEIAFPVQVVKLSREDELRK